MRCGDLDGRTYPDPRRRLGQRNRHRPGHRLRRRHARGAGRLGHAGAVAGQVQRVRRLRPQLPDARRIRRRERVLRHVHSGLTATTAAGRGRRRRPTSSCTNSATPSSTSHPAARSALVRQARSTSRPATSSGRADRVVPERADAAGPAGLRDAWNAVGVPTTPTNPRAEDALETVPLCGATVLGTPTRTARARGRSSSRALRAQYRRAAPRA